MAAKLSGTGASTFQLGQNADINVTPFVDVMLVLLIVFMVVAAAATSAVKVDLPATPVMKSVLPRQPVVVSVAADGNVYVNDTRATLDDLAGVVTGLTSDGQHEDRVVVRADKTINYETFMKVMSTLNIGGVGKVALVAEVN